MGGRRSKEEKEGRERGVGREGRGEEDREIHREMEIWRQIRNRFP